MDAGMYDSILTTRAALSGPDREVCVRQFRNDAIMLVAYVADSVYEVEFEADATVMHERFDFVARLELADELLDRVRSDCEDFSDIELTHLGDCFGGEVEQGGDVASVLTLVSALRAVGLHSEVVALPERLQIVVATPIERWIFYVGPHRRWLGIVLKSRGAVVLDGALADAMPPEFA